MPRPLPVGLAGRIHRLDRLVLAYHPPPILASRARRAVESWPSVDHMELYEYAKRNGLEIAWAYSPAFQKRLRTLSPDQFEIREVRTRKGMTKVLLFSQEIIKAEWLADKPRRDRLAAKRKRLRAKK